MENNKPEIIISTERLILRTWMAHDISSMALISSNPVVMEYFPSPQDRGETEQLINKINKQYERYGYTLYAVDTKNTGEFIGFVGLSHPSYEIPNFIPKGSPIVEIGWRLSSDYWGRGYATEAAKAVLAYAFIELCLDEIISFTTVANTKSRRVMEKIGLQHDETDNFDHPKLDDNSLLRKHVLYRLTRETFLRGNQGVISV